MNNIKHRRYCSSLPIIVGILTTPTILLYVKIVYGNMGFLQAFNELIIEQYKHGNNLFFIELLGLIPYAFLSAYMMSYTKKATTKESYAVCIGGIIGALIFTILGHFSIWHSIYTNAPGASTAVIGFLFIPFIAILPMCMGGYTGKSLFS